MSEATPKGLEGSGIICYPNPVLWEPTEIVDPTDPEVREFIDALEERMLRLGASGLAAPQVSTPWRVAVVNSGLRSAAASRVVSPSGEEYPGEARSARLEMGLFGKRGSLVLINPEILLYGDWEIKAREGCFSIPGVQAEVPRSYAIRVRSQTLDGEWVEWASIDKEARIVQHEVDHLCGKLLWDRLPRPIRQRKMKLARAIQDALKRGQMEKLQKLVLSQYPKGKPKPASSDEDGLSS